MELGRRSRERPAGGGEHLGPALLGRGEGDPAPGPSQGPRVGSSEETPEQPVGGGGPGSGRRGLKQGWY